MKRKVLLIILGFLIITLGICFTCYCLKDKAEVKEDLVYGPIKKDIFPFVIEDYYTDYFIISKNNLKGISDIEGNIIVDAKYDSISSFKYTDNYLIIVHDKKVYFYDKKGNLKKELESDNSGIDVIEDLVTNKDYFLNNSKFYNEDLIEMTNFNKIYRDDFNYNIINDHLYEFDDESLKVNVYDSNGVKVDTLHNFDDFVIDKYNVIISDDVNLVVMDNKLKEFKSYEYKNEKHIFRNDNDVLIIDDNGNTYTEEELDIVKLDKGYYQDFKGCNNDGSKLKNKKGDIIFDECAESYGIINIDKGVFVAYLDEDIIKIINKDNVKEIKNDILGVGFSKNYIFLGDNVYDFNLNKVNLCENETFIDNIGDINICANFKEDYFENNKEISFDDYNYYFNIISLKKDNNYALYYNNEFIYDFSPYVNVNIYDDYVVSNNINSSMVITFGKATKDKILDKSNFKYEKEEYKEDISKIILDYDLNDDKDIIYNNEEFFKKYAYVVNNSPNLKNYKKEMFKIFKIIALNKNNLNENSLLSSLKLLSINLVDKMPDEYGLVSGLYWYDDIKIEYLDDDYSVLYHELLHFIDANINYQNKYYLCDKTVYKKDDIDFQDTSKCEVYEFSDYRFLTEAGAEVYNGKYFNNDNIFSYAYAIRIYDILSYIYGEDKMEDIFFSSDSVYELYKIMNVSLSTFNDFMKKVNVMIEEGIIDNVEVEDIINLIIKLYEDKYNKVWYQDKLLNYMIASFNPDIENKEYLMDVSEISKTIDVNGKDIIGNHVRVIDNNVYYTVMDFIGKDAYLYKIKIDLDKKEPISYDVKLVN